MRIVDWKLESVVSSNACEIVLTVDLQCPQCRKLTRKKGKDKFPGEKPEETAPDTFSSLDDIHSCEHCEVATRISDDGLERLKAQVHESTEMRLLRHIFFDLVFSFSDIERGGPEDWKATIKEKRWTIVERLDT